MSPKRDIRDELRSLGERRKKQTAADAELAQEVEDTLRRAYNVVPLAEAARLLGVHRTTIYRVYHPHNG